MYVAWQLHDLFQKSHLSHNVNRSNSRMGNQQPFWMWQWLKQVKDEAPVIFWLCLQFRSVYWYKFIFEFTTYTFKLLYKLWNLYINTSWFLQKHTSISIQFSHYTILYWNITDFSYGQRSSFYTVTAWSTSIHMRLLEIHPPIGVTHPTANI